MSTVFLAREHHPNRLVAIKVLDPEVTVRLGRERFLREIDFVSNLTHPHLVPIFAAGEAEGLLYFVMPHVSGETLDGPVRDASRDFAHALELAPNASELEPEMVESRALEGRALLLNGQARECLAIAYGPHAAIRAACLHAVGQPDSAAAIADSVARTVTTGQSQDGNYTDVLRADGLATYYAWVGDVERAMQWLEWAFDRSPLAVERRVLQSALFDRVRADPEARRRIDRLTRAVWDRVLQQQAAVR